MPKPMACNIVRNSQGIHDGNVVSLGLPVLLPFYGSLASTSKDCPIMSSS